MNQDEQAGGVNWKWFCILAGTMVMVGAATYFLLPSLISKTENDVIIVKALEEPFKFKPTEPGGKIVDHQNLLVVDILKGGTKEADQTETLRPTAPNPEPPPVNVTVDAKPKISDDLNREAKTIEPVQNGVVAPDRTSESATKNAKKHTKTKDLQRQIRDPHTKAHLLVKL